MSNQVPNIQPIKVKQYEVKQSKYNQVSRIPTSKILLGPSHSGKGVLLSNMILDIEFIKRSIDDIASSFAGII